MPRAAASLSKQPNSTRYAEREISGGVLSPSDKEKEAGGRVPAGLRCDKFVRLTSPPRGHFGRVARPLGPSLDGRICAANRVALRR